MDLIDNSGLIQQVGQQWKDIKSCLKEPLIMEPFLNDFRYRFCWNSNSIEGNTLSLDETVSLIEYDEVRSGHTYSEYTEAKNLYRAIGEMFRLGKTEIDEAWIKKVNALVMDSEEGYRNNNLYIGTLIEAVHYPPDHENVPGLMKEYIASIQAAEKEPFTFDAAAEAHILFERIHPFRDGNGRTGRLVMNQMLVNAGWLPITIESQSKYRQAFKRYASSGDVSLMVHQICKGELSAIEQIKTLRQKLPDYCEKNGRKCRPVASGPWL